MVATPERRAPVAVGAVVAGIALAVRLVFLFTGAPDEEGQLGITDPLYYHAQANALAEGRWFIEPFQFSFAGRLLPSATHPPLYTLVLAAGSVLGFTSLLAHQVLSILVGTAAAVAVALLGRRLAGDRAGLLAGLLAAVYPQFWLNDATMRAETLFTLVVAVVLLLAYRRAGASTPVAAGVLGLAVGVAALTRGEALLLLPVLVLPLVLREGSVPLGRRLALVGVAGVVAVAVITPWVARNLRAFEEPVLLSNNVGEVIGGANCDISYEGDGVGLWYPGCLEGLEGDESQRSVAARRRGTAWARTHRSELPKVALVRAARVWDLYAPVQNATFNAGTGRPQWATELALAGWYAVVPAAVAGAVVLARRRVTLLPLAATAVLVTVTAVASWGAVRFRIPAEVAALALAGVGLDALASAVAGRRRPAPAP